MTFDELMRLGWKFDPARQQDEQKLKPPPPYWATATPQATLPHVLKYERQRTRLRKLRERILKKNNNSCYLCQKPLDINSMTIEHYIPRSKGGRNNLENLFPACWPCNQKKGDSMPHAEILLT